MLIAIAELSSFLNPDWMRPCGSISCAEIRSNFVLDLALSFAILVILFFSEFCSDTPVLNFSKRLCVISAQFNPSLCLNLGT